MLGYFTVGGFTTIVGVVALLAPEGFGICALVISSLFAAATALPLPGMGGIQPAHFLVGFLILALLFRKEWRSECSRFLSNSASFLLLISLLVAVFTTALMPRIFDGDLIVYPLRAEGLSPTSPILPLSPSGGNVTQTIYILGDSVCFLLAGTYTRGSNRLISIGNFYLVYALLNVTLAGADYITSKTGTSALLSFMRNADYLIFDNVNDLGLDRVKGSFTEASAFCFATVGTLTFCMRLGLSSIRPKICFATAVASLVFILLSTSSTGYLSAGLCLGFLYLGSLARTVRGDRTAEDRLFLIFGPTAVLVTVLSIAVVPALNEAVMTVLNAVIFDKSESESGIERAAMNMAGMRAFLDTYGLGVGLGSTRASSFIVAMLSSLGILGSVIYSAFLLKAFDLQDTWNNLHAAKVRKALQCSLAASLLAASLSGALVDLGVVFFLLMGAVCAGPRSSFTDNVTYADGNGATI